MQCDEAIEEKETLIMQRDEAIKVVATLTKQHNDVIKEKEALTMQHNDVIEEKATHTKQRDEAMQQTVKAKKAPTKQRDEALQQSVKAKEALTKQRDEAPQQSAKAKALLPEALSVCNEYKKEIVILTNELDNATEEANKIMKQSSATNNENAALISDNDALEALSNSTMSPSSTSTILFVRGIPKVTLNEFHNNTSYVS